MDCRSFKIGCNITVSGKFKALGRLHEVMHLILTKMSRLVK